MVVRNMKFRSIQTNNNLSHQESPKSNYENLNPNFLALKNHPNHLRQNASQMYQKIQHF